MGICFGFYKMKCMKMTSGNGYVALWMYLIPLNCILSNGQDGKFYVYWSQFKKWKNQLKMDCKLSCKIWNYKTQRKQRNTLWLRVRQIFLYRMQKTCTVKDKSDEFYFIKTEQVSSKDTGKTMNNTQIRRNYL